ncbi:MAG TPA: hypothetical protein VFD31_02300 [Thermoleophilaceae bacterium]|nr:hypothetical protein [Thermoleophilaceae bacterium]
MRPLTAILLAAALLVAGCGGDDGDSPGAPGGAAKAVAPSSAVLERARSPKRSDFPAAKGRTLEQISSKLPAVNIGLATSVFTPGENRLAFGMLDRERSFLYGRSAVYLARTPTGRALGPFLAPADPLVVEPPFRSRGAAEPGGDIAAIYDARVKLPSPGRWYVLAVTNVDGQLFGAPSRIQVNARENIPDVGEPAPRVKTDTLASAGGDIESIDTRVPPSDMHEESFDEVAGKKPVALLFATPRLCQTRVCGPVVDIAEQLRRSYGDRMTFIHQEVYNDNMVEKGLRPPLQTFRLRTEPWLFTIDRDGKVAARLEGSFGTEAFEEAVKAAL